MRQQQCPLGQCPKTNTDLNGWFKHIQDIHGIQASNGQNQDFIVTFFEVHPAPNLIYLYFHPSRSKRKKERHREFLR